MLAHRHGHTTDALLVAQAKTGGNTTPCVTHAREHICFTLGLRQGDHVDTVRETRHSSEAPTLSMTTVLLGPN